MLQATSSSGTINRAFTKKVRTKTQMETSTFDSVPFSQEISKTFNEANHSRHQGFKKYQQIIKKLKDINCKLLKRNQFVEQDRRKLISENYDINRENQKLRTLLEVKNRLGSQNYEDTGPLFQVIVQSNRLPQTNIQENSVQNSQTWQQSEAESQSNLLEESSQQMNSNINNHEMLISNNPLSSASRQEETQQISMSNIGQTQRQVHSSESQQTPGLASENIFIQIECSSANAVIRAFYLSLMQKKQTTQKLLVLFDEIKNDTTITLYEKYPTNQFWTDMLSKFMSIVQQGYFDSQTEVLEYIKIHRIIDELLIKCLRSRIEFIFESQHQHINNQKNNQKIFMALANIFGLRIESTATQYIFYSKEYQDENLLLSQRPSLEISLNNREDNNVYFLKEQDPLFIVHKGDGNLQFSFFIMVEDQAASRYQLNEAVTQRDNMVLGSDQTMIHQSFRYSQEDEGEQPLSNGNSRTVIIYSNQKGSDHFDGVANILNERELNLAHLGDISLSNNNKTLPRPTTKRARQSENRQPLNSSRFFINRIATNQSFSEEENDF